MYYHSIFKVLYRVLGRDFLVLSYIYDNIVCLVEEVKTTLKSAYRNHRLSKKILKFKINRSVIKIFVSTMVRYLDK